MSETDAVTAEATSTGEPQAEVDGASADPETVLTEFSTKTWRDDLTLVVENRQLYVSKSVLALASPIFDEMITAECQEQDKGEITLPGKKLDDFVEFLKCIYPGKMKPVTLENVFKVLPLASQYQVETLKSACEVCLLNLLSNTKINNNVYVILKRACVHGLEKAKEICIDIITERPHEEFDKAASAYSFSSDMQNEIRKRYMQALSIKNKHLSGRVKTSEALNRFLGDMASRRELVNQYLEGCLDGDYLHLKLTSKYNTSGKMCIGGLSFTVSVKKMYDGNLSINIECKTELTVNGLMAILIHNWMQGIRDKEHVSNVTFSNQKASNSVRVGGFTTDSLENEKAGFMYKGTMDCYIYLFCTK